MLTAQDTLATATLRRPNPKAISTGIALLITGVLLYVSLREIEWRQVWLTATGAKLPYLGLGLALSSGTLLLRALRWRVLLTAEGPIGIRAVFSATAAGYFGNNFLPARAGELVRTFMVSSRSGLNNAYVLATAISERVADVIALVSIASIVLLTLPHPPGWLLGVAKPVAILGLAAVLVIVILPRLESLLQKLMDLVPVPAGLRIKLKSVLEQALRGMRTFHNPRRLLTFAGLTAVIWCIDACLLIFVGRALGLPVSLPIAFLLLAGLGLGSALPSAPGYIGVYQFIAVTVLTPFGISRADAIAFILVGQALQYVVIGFWGALGIAQYRKMSLPTGSIGDRLEEAARWLDRQPTLIFAFLVAIYVILLQPLIHRDLWFDELHTFYIAQAPTMSRFIEELQGLDLNPPMLYALVRSSLALFGSSELVTRMPTILGYLLASAAMFIFVRRRAGALWAAAGVAVFWYSPFFYFASEARPYGVLLGFMGLTLIAWDFATTDSKRGWALAGIAVGNTGMLLSHVFAPLAVMPFCVGELVRNWRQRRIDWPMWAALLFPLLSIAVYIPLIRSAEAYVFPPAFQGSVHKAVWFYLKLFAQVLAPLMAASIVAFAISLARRQARGDDDSGPTFKAHEIAFLGASLLPPALLNAITMHEHTAFYDRYGITAVLTMYILLILFVAYESRVNRLAGLAAAVITIGFILIPGIAHLPGTPPVYAAKYVQVHPELPFVDNSALTFLEMDHYENPAFLSRLYYLVDHDSAIRYSQSTLTERMPLLAHYFPVRANVDAYSNFVTQHRHFLVYGMLDHDGDWLLKKLTAEGATLTEIGKFETPYLDSQLYEVTLAPDGVANAR